MNQKNLDFLPWVIFAGVTAVFIALCGCGVSATATDVRSSPGHMEVHSDGDCVGWGCAPGYYGGPGNLWVAGGMPAYPWGPSDGRFAAIEAYRSQNNWVRTGRTGAPTASGNQDPRVDETVDIVRDLTVRLCERGQLAAEDCPPRTSVGTVNAPVAPSAPSSTAASSAATTAPAPATPGTTAAPAPAVTTAPEPLDIYPNR
jgi:hypothetical protein